MAHPARCRKVCDLRSSKTWNVRALKKRDVMKRMRLRRKRLR